MSALLRFLSAIGIGVVHFALTLRLGPSIHCAEARGCPDLEWVQAPSTDAFALPLSLARATLAPAFAGRSFEFYSAFNSLAFGLVALAVLWIYATIRARL